MKIQLAIQAISAILKKMKDENTRYLLFAAILLPFVMIFLTLAMLVYIISTPLSFLTNLFGGDSISAKSIEEFKKNPAVMQYSASGYYDELVYEDYEIIHNDRVITYYNQLELPWKNMLYGFITTIGNSGCGPTSMAIILSTILEQRITPAEMADSAYKGGYLVQYYDLEGLHASTRHDFIPETAMAYGLVCEGFTMNDGTEQNIIDALGAGEMIVAIMGPGQFTESGHYIILSGITAEGTILVVDCASRKRTEQEWDIESIIDEAKTDADAGGPFWVIYRPDSD
jgi:hypothetical protein